MSPYHPVDGDFYSVPIQPLMPSPARPHLVFDTPDHLCSRNSQCRGKAHDRSEGRTLQSSFQQADVRAVVAALKA